MGNSIGAAAAGPKRGGRSTPGRAVGAFMTRKMWRLALFLKTMIDVASEVVVMGYS
jgi:hypothetical protein